jgi:hypothetical protein
MRTYRKPRDQVLRALKASRRDPEKTGEFFKKLSGCWLTYCCYKKKVRAAPPDPDGSADKQVKTTNKFILLSFKEKSFRGPVGGVVTNHEAVMNHEAEEFVPFYLSLSEAKEQIKALRTGGPKIHFQTSKAASFFHRVLHDNKIPCLFPGAEYARTFTDEEMREVIRLSQRPKIPPHTKTRVWKEYLRLKEIYVRESAKKVVSQWSSPGKTPNLAQLLEVAEYSLGERISFNPKFKKALLALPNNENLIKLSWNIIWSLANIYHIFHFSEHDFPPERFLEETGLEVSESENPQNSVIFDPEKEEDMRICFRILEKKKKIMLNDLETSLESNDRPA